MFLQIGHGGITLIIHLLNDGSTGDRQLQVWNTGSEVPLIDTSNALAMSTKMLRNVLSFGSIKFI